MVFTDEQKKSMSNALMQAIELWTEKNWNNFENM